MSNDGEKARHLFITTQLCSQLFHAVSKIALSRVAFSGVRKA